MVGVVFFFQERNHPSFLLPPGNKKLAPHPPISSHPSPPPPPPPTHIRQWTVFNYSLSLVLGKRGGGHKNTVSNNSRDWMKNEEINLIFL